MVIFSVTCKGIDNLIKIRIWFAWKFHFGGSSHRRSKSTKNATYVTKLKMPLEKNLWAISEFFLWSWTHSHSLPFNPRYGYFFIWISFRTKITRVFAWRMLRFSDTYDYFHIYMEKSGSYEQWVFFMNLYTIIAN